MRTDQFYKRLDIRDCMSEDPVILHAVNLGILVQKSVNPLPDLVLDVGPRLYKIFPVIQEEDVLTLTWDSDEYVGDHEGCLRAMFDLVPRGIRTALVTTHSQVYQTLENLMTPSGDDGYSQVNGGHFILLLYRNGPEPIVEESTN
jgi:hypothetical protein